MPRLSGSRSHAGPRRGGFGACGQGAAERRHSVRRPRTGECDPARRQPGADRAARGPVSDPVRSPGPSPSQPDRELHGAPRHQRPRFRQRQYGRGSGGHFRAPPRQGVDLSEVAVLEPDLEPSPEITSQGHLHLAGRVRSFGHQIEFELVFSPVDGRWRLAGIATNVTLPQAEASRAEPPALRASTAPGPVFWHPRRRSDRAIRVPEAQRNSQGTGL